MQININEVINKIDSEIKQYTEKFLMEKMAIEESTSNHASILFERTLSSAVNYFLFNYFFCLSNGVIFSTNKEGCISYH